MNHSPAEVPTRTPEGQAWLDQHPEVDPDALEQVWHMAEHARTSEEATPINPVRLAAVRAAIQARAEAEVDVRPGAVRPGRHPSRPARPQRRIPRWMLTAAVIVVLMGIGLGYALRPVTHTAPLGETLATVLPDGSHIELNSGASVTYRRTFGSKARAVRLEGEAYFDVVTAAVPFVVETFNARVTVLGTRFNVQAWPGGDSEATTVVLEEGRVELAAQAVPDAPVVLTPGQQSRVDVVASLPSAPVDVDVDRALAWRTGGFVFSDEPLGAILAEVGRRFGVRIRAHSEALRAARMSLFLQQASSADVVLDVICSTLACRYQSTVQGFDVVAASDAP